MNDFIDNITRKIKHSQVLEPEPIRNSYIHQQTKITNTVNKLISDFELPITYLTPSLIHPLSSTVANDLELNLHTPNNLDLSCVEYCSQLNKVSMYDNIFTPKHIFAKQMITQWVKQYTTNIPYLKDTQQVIQNSQLYLDNMKKYNENAEVDCEKIIEIWNDVKCDNHFLEKYNYMDWEILSHLNNSTTFLQSISLVNIISPLITLILPILFLILPFIILKFQGIPITFTIYIEVLKTLAKNHFIGKTLLSMDNFTIDKIGYIFITILFYAIQIYQNLNSCYRFYNNIKKMNEQLLTMRKYVRYSIVSMDTFVNINEPIAETYNEFFEKTKTHIIILKKYSDELNAITPFNMNISKMNDIGYMLKCFYDLHLNKEYEKSLSFSIGFEGYLNNVLGIYDNIQQNHISSVSFNIENETSFVKQYYPPYKLNVKHKKNTCSLKKNMIITGVNASGKTTLLKTTTINIIFSQQFGYGFFKSCSLNPYTHIHSYLNIPDTSARDSLFQAESRRCKEIIDIINDTENHSKNTVDIKYKRHFCIFDELYSGTNPTDATKSAYAFLLYLNKYNNVDYMLTTHYLSVCKKFANNESIANYKMKVEVLSDGSFTYTYTLKPGISKIQGAVEILKQLEYPSEIIDNIRNDVTNKC